jgi:hypothetical protein
MLGTHMANFPLAFTATLESLASFAGLTRGYYKAGIDELRRQGMVKTDWSRRVVLLPNGLKHELGVKNRALSSTTVRGWIPRVRALADSEIKTESVLLTLEAAFFARPSGQTEKEAHHYTQAVETLKLMLDAPSLAPYRAAYQAAYVGGWDALASRFSFLVSPFSSSPPSPPQILSAAASAYGGAGGEDQNFPRLVPGRFEPTAQQARFLRAWNAARTRDGSGEEQLTPVLADGLERVFYEIRKRIGDDPGFEDDLIREFFEGRDRPKSRKLSTFVQERIFADRLATVLAARLAAHARGRLP